MFDFLKKNKKTEDIESNQETTSEGQVQVSDAEWKVIMDVAARFAEKAPPIDPNTYNFIYGDEYKNISAGAKLNFYLSGIGRLFEAEKAKSTKD